MGKVIVKNESSFPDVDAMAKVHDVMCDGRVSKSNNGDCYCFVTAYKNGRGGGLQIIAQRTKSGTDTFLVRNITPNEDMDKEKQEGVSKK